MKTRTLLLLAVTCGLAILVAGTVQLLRVSGQDDVAPPLKVGATGRAGDAQVTLLGVTFDESTLTVSVRLAGVADADGLTGFSMVSAGERTAVSGGTCAQLTVVPQECTLTFANAGLTGVARQLLFRRAEDQLRWVLINADGVAA